MKRVFNLVTPQARANCARYVEHEAPDGYRVTVEEQRKTRDQEEKYHAMFADISRQVKCNGVPLNEGDMKRALFSAFKLDTKDDPDLQEAWKDFGDLRMGVGFRGEIIVFGDQTRKLPKKLASALIEWLYAFGAEHDVQWTEPKSPQRKRQQAIEQGRVDAETGEIMEVAA